MMPLVFPLTFVMQGERYPIRDAEELAGCIAACMDGSGYPLLKCQDANGQRVGYSEMILAAASALPLT